jgi:6-phosphogluconolactonase (cycloisomerase 2 family)
MSPDDQGPVALYLAIGAEITVYAIDPIGLTLTPGPAAQAPEAVQYVWRHPSLPLLYAAFSNRGVPGGDDRHGVAVFRMDQQTGALTTFGEPTFLDSRPIHLTLDPGGRFLLVAYNMPSMLSVHRLGEDGAVGAQVGQAEPVDAGIYAHQVRVAPSGRFVVLPVRGNDAKPSIPEDPGSIRIFRFQEGQLSPATSIKGTGSGCFGPRHVDFHPSQPWLYAALERGNQLLAYAMAEDGAASLIASSDTVSSGADRKAPEQYAGAIHVHPSGQFVYVMNRSDGTVGFQGQNVHGGGENSVACFAIDPATGAPGLIQRVDTQSFHCRTFSIHPNGRMLVTAAVGPMLVRDGQETRTVPPALTVFGIGEDGRLQFAHKYDIETGGRPMFWCGMVALAAPAVQPAT